MITSYTTGRVRIRHAALKNPENMAVVENIVNSQEGIKEVTSNLLTGSMLIKFDPEVLTEDKLKEAAKLFEEHFPAQSKSCSCGFTKLKDLLPRKTEHFLLLSTLGLTAGSLFFSRRVHAIAGLAYFGLIGYHLFRREVHLKKHLTS